MDTTKLTKETLKKIADRTLYQLCLNSGIELKATERFTAETAIMLGLSEAVEAAFEHAKANWRI